MAKIYSPPAGYEAPSIDDCFVDGHYDRHLDDKIHAEYLARLAEFVKRSKRNTVATHKDGDLIGEVVHFPYADGAAAYMVWNVKPLELVHLAIHDAWQLDEAHERGLRVSDIRQIVERDRAWKKLAEETRDWWAEQPLGAIFHYHNGFGQYVRCEVVDGEWDSFDGHQQGRCLQPIALVGNWDDRDLRAGSYHAKKVVERSGAWRCNTSCIYELPSFSRPKGDAGLIDPTVLEPLELGAPA